MVRVRPFTTTEISFKVLLQVVKEKGMDHTSLIESIATMENGEIILFLVKVNFSEVVNSSFKDSFKMD